MTKFEWRRCRMFKRVLDFEIAHCDRFPAASNAAQTVALVLKAIGEARVDEITVRRVLSHTTGLPNFRSSRQPLAFAFAPRAATSASHGGAPMLSRTHAMRRLAACTRHPTDYSKFLIEILDPKPADAFRLSRAMRDEMIRPQIKLEDGSSWALGWQIMPGSSGDLLFHTGDNPGFKALVVASVPQKSGRIALMNGDNARPIFQDLVDAKCPLNDLISGKG